MATGKESIVMELEIERTSLITTTQTLDASGMNVGTTGNISVRTTGGMLITPTGIATSALRPEQMVAMQLDGSWDAAFRPSSEWEMHAEIYKAFPEAGAVVHAHPDHCVALSCLREPLPLFHYMVAGFGGDDVRCSDYALFASSELAKVAVVALKDRTACLLANHGMIAFGGDLDTALIRTIKLETLARQYLLARSAGTPVLIEGSEIPAIRGRYKNYGQQK
ncbi:MULTISPECIES: class II aldolase/adducin family protein [unclassified Mesorhizobium]|uniref:class II aldolase/adducin family protein n=2 Tax=Phyllobacteriaceae TaxID=69277 RepID=UPI001FE21F12|nr:MULTISPECIES: class II aldolase/adducin family protein [unclassified Mesorhizobium]